MRLRLPGWGVGCYRAAMIGLSILLFVASCQMPPLESESSPGPGIVGPTMTALSAENRALATRAAVLPAETPAPGVPPATVSALATENARLAARVATLEAVTPVPTSPPAATVPAPKGSILIYYRNGTVYSQNIAAPGIASRQPIFDASPQATHLVLSPLGYLAYVSRDILYVADLVTREAFSVVGATSEMNPAWDLRWSDDGRELAYALAYSEGSGQNTERKVQLGVTSGRTARTVAAITMPAAVEDPTEPAEPAFSKLQLLHYDRTANRLLVTPTGGAEQFKSVWAFDIETGERSAVLEGLDAAAPQAMVASPAASGRDMPWLAMAFTPNRIEIYDLETPATSPRVYSVPAGVTPGPMMWSPDGESLAFVLYGDENASLDVTPERGLWVLEAETMLARKVADVSDAGVTLAGWTPESDALMVGAFNPLSGEREHYLVTTRTHQVTMVNLLKDTQVLGWVP